jgi:hypothetical protein
MHPGALMRANNTPRSNAGIVLGNCGAGAGCFYHHSIPASDAVSPDARRVFPHVVVTLHSRVHQLLQVVG